MKPEDSISEYAGQPLNRQILMGLLKDYRRPHDKLSEMVRQGKLIPLKRGLFVAGPKLRIEQPEPFLLANHLAGPSYVSLETALSHWGLIPEKVFEIASVTMGRSKTYPTPLGNFSYLHMPLPYYSFGQQRVELKENQAVLIAMPEKAICDKIIATSGLIFRSEIQVHAWLVEDMRMDPDVLRNLNTNTIGSWLKSSPKRSSLSFLIKTMEGL